MPCHQLSNTKQNHEEVCLAHAQGWGYILKVEQFTILLYFGPWAGYHHIPLDDASIPKTAFTSPFGKYEYLKVPFALAQFPAYF